MLARVRIRLHSVRVAYGAPLAEVMRAAAAKVGLPEEELSGFEVVRRSLDARRGRVSAIYAVEFEGDAAIIADLAANEAAVVEKAEFSLPEPGAEKLEGRPVIIGAGPAGLFSAFLLAEAGYGPLVVERGRALDERDRDVAALMRGEGANPESNLLFGEGGAGTYSDGKLTTRIHDARVRRVLEVFCECGAPEAILIDARPHIGSDLLGGVVGRLRRRIEAAGGEFRFGWRVEGLVLDKDGGVAGVEGTHGRGAAAGAVVLAPGSSARGLFEALLAQGVAIEAKPFQVGVRIEHPQEVIDRAVYGGRRSKLPPAEYIYSARRSQDVRGVATFCMCPGGTIVPAISEEGCLSTNGASNSARGGRFCNSALVVTVSASDLQGEGPLPGVEFQRRLERAAFEVSGDYRAPAQRAQDFIAGRKSQSLPKCSYPLGVVSADLQAILPGFLTDAVKKALPYFDRKLPGFVAEGLLVGVEARVSSPVRITRGAAGESISTPRLYPAGEGSGYAGGIASSAVDGMKAAEAVISRFSRP